MMTVQQEIDYFIGCDYDHFRIYVGSVSVFDGYSSTMAEKCPDYIWNLEIVNSVITDSHTVAIYATFDNIVSDEPFPVFNNFDRFSLDQKQHGIDIYVAEKNEQIVKSVDRLGHKYGAVFAERYFSELGNRLCELNPDLDYIAMVDISRGSVSYRTIRDDLDLGEEIAHAYGGGGHPKAAVSTFDGDAVRDTLTELIFEEGCMSSIIKSICKREGIEYF